MDDTEATIHRLSFIRDLVKRVVPEAEVMYPEEPLPDKAAEIERAPKKNYRPITHTAQLNYAHNYVFIDERLEELRQEKQKLLRKYKELDKAIDAEIEDLAAEKERLRNGIRYLVIAEEEQIIETQAERAAKPTSAITPSRELNP